MIYSSLLIILSNFAVIAIVELKELFNYLNLRLKIVLPSISEGIPEQNVLQDKIINSKVLQSAVEGCKESYS